jgi:hypothetical protein
VIYKFAQVCLIFAIFAGDGLAGTISSYYTRGDWESAVGAISSFTTDNFANPQVISPATMGFAFASLTSTGQQSVSSSADPTVSIQDTSALDLLPTADGGNYIGSAGRSSVYSSTYTETNTMACDQTDPTSCITNIPARSVDWFNYKDVRKLGMNFYTPTFNFGFDYIAFLDGSSPNRITNAFKMILTFADGTKSSIWVNGDAPIYPDPSTGTGYADGFMGVTSDTPIASVTLRGVNRYLGFNEVATGSTDFTYQYSDATSDYYGYQYTDTISSDQTSSLLLTNLSATDVAGFNAPNFSPPANAPEPGTVSLFALAGLLIAASCGIRKLVHARRKHTTHRAG